MSVALATLLRWALDPILGETSQYITFYAAVMLAAAAGGLGPGLLATALGALMGSWLFVQPRDQLALGTPADMVRLAVLLVVGVGVSLIAERLHAHRRRAEQNSALLGVTLASIGDGLIVTDTQGRVSFLNPEAQRLTGWRSAEASRQPLAAVFHIVNAQTRQPVESPAEKVLRLGTVAGLANHTILIAKDGRETSIDDSGAPIRQADGTVGGVVLVFRDVTERQQAEAALAANLDAMTRLQRLGTLYVQEGTLPVVLGEMVEAAIAIAGADFGNSQLLDEKSRNLRIVAHRGFPQWWIDFWNNVTEGRGVCGTVLARGERVIVEDVTDSPIFAGTEALQMQLKVGVRAVVSTPLLTRSGRLVGVLSTHFRRPHRPDDRVLRLLDLLARQAADLVEHAQTEERLRLQASALEAAASSIAITDAQGIIHWANPACAELTGYSVQELIGQSHRILQSGQQDEPFYRNLWETILRGEVWRGELVNRRKDGTLYDEEQTIAPVRDAQGQITHFIAVKQDVSLRKATEQAMAAARISSERAKAKAEEASKAKDHFLAVLSHELRTPLSPVTAAVSILRQKPQVDEETRDTLEMILRNVELEARLIDDLLDVTRISRGKVELHKSEVQLCTVINGAIVVCKPDLEERGLHFAVDWGSRPYWVHGDIARLQQVFWNLLKNSIKFTPHDGCVGLRCYREDGRVVAEVIDSGVGFEPHAKRHLFDAFEQAERSITRHFGGLGLGLTISKAMVELHGGVIEAHSEGKGKGATFRVKLPLTVPAPAPARPAPVVSDAAVQPADAIVRPLRLLLVEDHGDTARIMKRLLESDGHEVKTAGDVATALARAGEDRFDLLISDLGLPDASGLDLMRELRRLERTLPGIALSGYGQEQDIQRSREAGFAMHLIKPVNPDQLRQAIASVAPVPQEHDAS